MSRGQLLTTNSSVQHSNLSQHLLTVRSWKPNCTTMAGLMDVGSGLRLSHWNNMRNLPFSSTVSSWQGSPGCSCSVSPPSTSSTSTTLSSNLLRSNVISTPQLWRLRSQALCKDYSLLGPPLLCSTRRRQTKRTGIVRSEAASSSSCPSEAHSDTNFVTLLGKRFPKKDAQVVYTAIATVLLSVTNKILYKMALVPLKQYPLFLAQLSTISYVLVYSSTLYVRYRAGIVTKAMLQLPRTKFLVIGLLEAFAIAMGMASAAVLPGASIPVLTQVFLVWQLILSSTLLGERYTFGQVGGCLMVVAGVVLVLASGSGVNTVSIQRSGLFWPFVMIVSTLFSAAASLMKEFVFQEAAQVLKGGSLDIFVVNTFGSTCQALFVFFMLPFLFNLRGIPVQQVLQHMREGYACFVNVGGKVKGCQGAPWVPVLYIVVNMAFNICSLSLLKQSSAVMSSLTQTLSIPLSIWAFTFPWPYLGAAPKLPPGLFVGAAILIAGLASYSLSSPPKKRTHKK